MVIPQAPGQNTRGFGVGNPLIHALGVAKCGEPFEQKDEAFTFARVANLQRKHDAMKARERQARGDYYRVPAWIDIADEVSNPSPSLAPCRLNG